MCLELGHGRLRARIDSYERRRAAREILHRAFGLRRPLEGLELDARQRPVVRRELRRREVELLGIENRTLPVVTQLLMALADAGPDRIDPRKRLLHVDQQTPGRQVLEQMRGALEEQRQVELDAARRLTRAHVAIDRMLGQIPGEAQPIAAPELAHAVRTERRLARRQQIDALELIARALRVRVEAAED